MGTEKEEEKGEITPNNKIFTLFQLFSSDRNKTADLIKFLLH